MEKGVAGSPRPATDSSSRRPPSARGIIECFGWSFDVGAASVEESEGTPSDLEVQKGIER